MDDPRYSRQKNETCSTGKLRKATRLKHVIYLALNFLKFIEFKYIKKMLPKCYSYSANNGHDNDGSMAECSPHT